MNNLEEKKCMPDNVNSKKEHEEYLKAIGYCNFCKGRGYKDNQKRDYPSHMEIEDKAIMYAKKRHMNPIDVIRMFKECKDFIMKYQS